jgi:hypothetical protein
MRYVRTGGRHTDARDLFCPGVSVSTACSQATHHVLSTPVRYESAVEAEYGGWSTRLRQSHTYPPLCVPIPGSLVGAGAARERVICVSYGLAARTD